MYPVHLFLWVVPLLRLNDVDSMDKLKDVYMHFLLYYGRDIPKMHNALNRPKKKNVRTKLVRRPAKKMVKVTVRRPKHKKKLNEDDSDSENDKDWTEEDAKRVSEMSGSLFLITSV